MAQIVAEGAGFEPAIPFPVYTLSRRAPSTTRPPLRIPLVRQMAGALRRGSEGHYTTQSPRARRANPPDRQRRKSENAPPPGGRPPPPPGEKTLLGLKSASSGC